MSETCSRFNALPDLFDRVNEVMYNYNFRLDHGFSSKDVEDRIEQAIIEYYRDYDIEALVREGVVGLNDLCSLELIGNAIDLLYSPNLYEDFEFEGTIWHDIEKELLRFEAMVISEAINDTILK